jgi:Domain of unknown function (DUF222)
MTSHDTPAPSGGLPATRPDDSCPLAAEHFAEQAAILAEQESWGLHDLPPAELAGDAQALPVPPSAAAAWDGACPLTAEQMATQEAALAEIIAWETGETAPSPSLPWPDVSVHDHLGPGGAGFAPGSALDTLPPGPGLAAALDDTFEHGLDGLPDDQLAGVILAARRCESRATAQLLAAVDELGRRRVTAPDRRVAEFLDTELALLLTLTRRAAGTLLGFAAGMAQLPATAAALAEGRIHRAQADTIAYETGLLDPELAAAVEQLVIEDAPQLTTTRLQRRVRHAVLAADPDAARRRAEQARRDARVELRDERSGATAALAGRDLPTAAASAADQRINAAAHDLKAAGVPATLAQLRAAVFLSLLTGTDPQTFLLPPEDPAEAAPATPPATGDQPSASTTTAQPAPNEQPVAGAADDQPTPSEQATAGQAAGQPTPSEQATAGQHVPASGQPPPGAAGAAPSRPAPGLGVRGTVNLTLPLATWIGATYSPGDIAGLGPATAETCQELADWIAASPGSRWCLTVTDSKGRAVGHGCARRPPPAPADTQRLAEWLARLKIGPIQAGECTHARAVPGYRIPDSLDHIVKIRQQTCSNPICARPATQSDDDHTRAHDKGGITCECGLGPACRHCHQAKQAAGWRLEQPRPGEFIWRPPHGRSYPANPDTYPT